MNYTPTKPTEEILNEALKTINSVPYNVSLRWTFYQLVQRYGFPKKSYRRFLEWSIRARKNFWNGWSPNTLYDGTRSALVRGVPTNVVPAQPDRIKDQKNYIELWFEANAMLDQFWYYTKDFYVTLVPFGGDASIPFKWEIAKRLEDRYETYSKPIIILYFGDCDPKGKMIPESALKDIRNWCSAPFVFVYCGLTLEQAKRFKAIENPEKPGQYQWEALEDGSAKEIILNNLSKYLGDEISGDDGRD